MPSLNLKTKKLRYTKADANVVDACLELLDMIEEYGEAAIENEAGECRVHLNRVAGHVASLRDPKPATGKKSPPQPAA